METLSNVAAIIYLSMNCNGIYYRVKQFSSIYTKISVYLIYVTLLCLISYDVLAAPPRFSNVPRSRIEAKLGRSLLLRCSATGDPKPVITWMKGGFEITNGQRGIDVKRGELKIMSLLRHHAGRYVCRAHNAEGTKQHSTDVVILAPPQLIRKPQPGRAREEESVAFQCRAQGYPPDINYRWFHNGLAVMEESGRYLLQSDGTLIIQNVLIGDRGHVTCEAGNGYGSPSRASTSLTVEYAARVVGMPEVVYGALSRTVKLPCPTLAEPPVNGVDWTKDGRQIYIKQSKRYDSDEKLNLIIYSLQESDSGRYTCTPRNSIGSRRSGSTRLEIKKLPEFKIKPSSQYTVAVGESFIAPCSGNGDSLSWRKIKVRNGAKDLIYCIDQGNLTIASVRKEHHGRWQCVLSSEVGDETTSTFIVVKNTTPHKVENVTAATLNADTVAVEWIPGYDGGITQHFVIWYKRTNEGSHTWRKLTVYNNRKSAVINQLIANTTYEVAVVGKNHLGSGEFSDVVNVKTKAIALPPSPPLIKGIAGPSNFSHMINKKGHVVLTWARQCCHKNIIGFVIEYRKIENSLKGINEPLVDLKSATSKTSWDGLQDVKEKGRKDDDSESMTGNRRKRDIGEWKVLSPVQANTTSYEIGTDQLQRDQLYEFQVLSVVNDQYSEPSQPLIVSTQGLTAYPLLPDTTPLAMSHPVIIGIVSGVFGVCLIILLVVALICRKQMMKERKSKLLHKGNNGKIPSGELQVNINDPDAYQKVDDPGESAASSSAISNQYSQEQHPLLEQKKHHDHPYCEEDEEEKEHLLNSYPISQEENFLPPFMQRRHSLSEESVRMRREMALRVLWAQRAPHQSAQGIRKIDLLPRRPASTTPFNQRVHNLSFRTACSPTSNDDSATTRPIPFEDRRHVEAGNAEPVYAVVKTKKISPSEKRSVFPHFYPSHSNDHAPFSSNSLTSFGQKIVPYSLSKSQKLKSSRQHMPAPCHTFFKESQIFPQERLLQKKHQIRDHAAPTAYFRSQDSSSGCASGDQQALEIDCSTNEIEVRLLRPPLTTSTSDYSIRDLCKVGSDNLDKKNKNTISPCTQLLKPCFKEKNSALRQHKRLGNEAANNDVTKSYLRLSDHDCHSLAGDGSVCCAKDRHVDAAAPLSSNRNFSNDKAAIHQSRKSPSKSQVKKELFQYCLRKHGSRQSTSDGDLSRYARPTLISLSEIPSDRVQLNFGFDTRSISTSLLNCHKEKFLPNSKPRQFNTYGSLGRSFKLGQLSNPFEKAISFHTAPPLIPFSRASLNIPSSSIKFPPVFSPIKNSNQRVVDDTFREFTLLPESSGQVLPEYMTSSPLSPMTSSASSRQPCCHGESLSSGYVTQEIFPYLHPLNTTSNAERSRKDNSSVEDNYEWDSEFAVESDILEAVKRFENLKGSNAMSEALRRKLMKFTRKRKIPASGEVATYSDQSSSPLSPADDVSLYSKENIERRCAILREEFLHYQKQRNRNYDVNEPN